MRELKVRIANGEIKTFGFEIDGRVFLSEQQALAYEAIIEFPNIEINWPRLEPINLFYVTNEDELEAIKQFYYFSCNGYDEDSSMKDVVYPVTIAAITMMENDTSDVFILNATVLTDEAARLIKFVETFTLGK